MSQIILNGIPPEDFWQQLRGIVQDVVATIPKPEKEKTFLTLDEVCELTNLSKSSIYQATSNNNIPFIKPRGKLLFNRAAIIQWLEDSAQPTQK